MLSVIYGESLIHRTSKSNYLLLVQKVTNYIGSEKNLVDWDHFDGDFSINQCIIISLLKFVHQFRVNTNWQIINSLEIRDSNVSLGTCEDIWAISMLRCMIAMVHEK